MHTIQYDNTTYSNLTREALKLHEAMCRGYHWDYVITMPDGYKLTAKFEGK